MNADRSEVPTRRLSFKGGLEGLQQKLREKEREQEAEAARQAEDMRLAVERVRAEKAAREAEAARLALEEIERENKAKLAIEEAQRKLKEEKEARDRAKLASRQELSRNTEHVVSTAHRGEVCPMSDAIVLYTHAVSRLFAHQLHDLPYRPSRSEQRR